MGLPCDKVGQGSRDNTQLSSFTKDKDKNKQNVNEIKFNLINSILFIHDSNVPQIKVS